MRVHFAVTFIICLGLIIFQGCVDYATIEHDGGNDCIPNCEGKCCGDDGCGGTCKNDCGSLGAYWVCNPNKCKCENACGCGTDDDCAEDSCCINCACWYKDCDDLECGPDPVCGKSCGTCTPPSVCENGHCIVPGSQLGDPCPLDTVNASASYCSAELECLGIPADGNAGTCPGGSPAECTDIQDNYNPDCVDGVCGFSFCALECCSSECCPQGFRLMDIGGT